MLNRTSYMDEFLCEYVDGTMDYSVRAAFEECVECDSRLARQVRHLCRTRQLLREYRLRTPKDLRIRVLKRLSRCLPLATRVRPPHTSILIGTATAIALAIALVAGASRYIPASLSKLQGNTTTVVETQAKNLWHAKSVYSGLLRALSSVV